ncbi:MAG: hypothetical protein E6356_16845 [Terrisporobacter othiniensis]|nr:hypothetical protein [Terrisporobacter othiniensis]
MENKFIYVFNEEDKKELILNGFKYICEQKMGNKQVYIFNNDSNKLNFTLDKSKYVMDNKLFF